MSSALSRPEQALVSLSATLATRDPGALRRALQDAAAHAEPSQVEETILQSYLFLGYPVALNAFGLWRGISGRASEPPMGDDGSWSERGERVCRSVYAGQYERLRANVRRLHPDMERWMVEEGYGKVLGRPGMALELRELCIVALLAVLDVPRQLFSHLRGALNVGADPTRVERALELAGRASTEGARERACQTWRAVLRRGGKGS
jgi:4-carboxymuconolactone decarboxylase